MRSFLIFIVVTLAACASKQQPESVDAFAGEPLTRGGEATALIRVCVDYKTENRCAGDGRSVYLVSRSVEPVTAILEKRDSVDDTITRDKYLLGDREEKFIACESAYNRRAFFRPLWAGYSGVHDEPTDFSDARQFLDMNQTSRITTKVISRHQSEKIAFTYKWSNGRSETLIVSPGSFEVAFSGDTFNPSGFSFSPSEKNGACR